MVNWQDPATVLKQLESLVKLVHVMDGIYIWEFLSTLDYEWSILRGRRNWRWTLWLYIGCRVFTFAEVLADLTGFNVTSPINCEAWMVLLLSFAYTSSTFALSLYGLRTIALWRGNRVVMAFVGVTFLTNVGFWIHAIAKSKAFWSPTINSCAIVDTSRGLPSNITNLVTDVLLIVVISAGLAQKRADKTRLWKLLYREGLLWLGLATVMQILPVAFLIMNFNDSMNLIFQTPSLICSTIGATRIYRLLSSIGSGNVLEYWESTRNKATGEIRFRRQTHFMQDGPDEDDHDGVVGTSSSTAVPLGRMGIDRFVERFEAREIRLEDDQVSDTKKAPE